jgi:hypothetical protein
MPQVELDASQLAQDVVDAWGMAMLGGNGKVLYADFEALFQKACAYRSAKEIADNRRESDRLTEQEAEHERITRTEFLKAYLPVARMALRWCEERV